MCRIVPILVGLFTGLIVSTAPAWAALSVPEGNTTCGGTYNSFYMTGGSTGTYTVYETPSATPLAWDASDQITWGTEAQVQSGASQTFLGISRDVGKFYKYRIVSGAETVTIRCPFWRSAATVPLSDSGAVAYVTQKAENIPSNADENAYYDASEVTTYQSTNAPDHYLDNVTGHYVDPAGTPTTSEIIQWAAAKWGVPLVILKSMAWRESAWNQAACGDRADGVDASLYPAPCRIDSDSVYESMGLTQIKWRPPNNVNPGTEPLRWKSTAFNADYAGARLRYFFDGYGPGTGGEERNSIGAHFTGGSSSSWGNADSDTYSQNNLNTVALHPWGSY